MILAKTFFDNRRPVVRNEPGTPLKYHLTFFVLITKQKQTCSSYHKRYEVICWLFTAAKNINKNHRPLLFNSTLLIW